MSVSRLVTIGLFLTGAALLGALELASRREGSRIPPLGELAGLVLRYRSGRLPVGRIAMYGFWWWLGWHFFAR